MEICPTDFSPPGMNVTLHNFISNDESSDSGQSTDLVFDSDILSPNTINSDVTAQLAAAGTVGRAAAAAIASAKKRKHPHSFETNPSVRKRQQTRLLRKLKAIIDEYTVRVGQQAVFLMVTPGKPQNNFKAFGAHPLENVVRKCKSVIMQELENALAEEAPEPSPEDPSLYELPPMVIDGIPTPVEKMTQAQLRAFIPLMLRYSTGRGKPGWGRESTKPQWWPKDLPWASVRSDARTEEQKLKVSWTHALRQIVLNCYKFHGREDLLPKFTDDDDEKAKAADVHPKNVQVRSTVVQAVNNPDGTLAIIHMDPNSALVTLPDGTHAEVRAVNWPENSQFQISDSLTDANQAVQEIISAATQINTASSSQAAIALELKPGTNTPSVATVQEATINQDGQIILTTGDGTQNSIPVANMFTIPASVYQSLLASISTVTDVQPLQSSPCIAVKSEVTESSCTNDSPGTMGEEDR